MAAWLAYLKSRLLLPEQEGDEEPSGEELAAALAFQLRRLEAMRDAGRQLLAQPQLGRDRFPRGGSQPGLVVRTHVYAVRLYAIVKAYIEQHRRTARGQTHIEQPTTYHTDVHTPS